jgi:hypothetical protein
MMAGVGHEKSVTDPLTCTPPRKIRHHYQGYKHTSLIPSICKSWDSRLTVSAYKLRNGCRNALETVVL